MLLAAIVVLNTACGLKAPPVPPKLPPITPITDLRVEAKDGFARLSWTSPPEHADIDSYLILRAIVDRDKPPCPECPQRFEIVVTMSPDRPVSDKDRQMSIVLPLETGLDYLFKVQPVLQSGSRGQESNRVRVAIP